MLLNWWIVLSWNSLFIDAAFGTVLTCIYVKTIVSSAAEEN